MHHLLTAEQGSFAVCGSQPADPDGLSEECRRHLLRLTACGGPHRHLPQPGVGGRGQYSGGMSPCAFCCDCKMHFTEIAGELCEEQDFYGPGGCPTSPQGTAGLGGSARAQTWSSALTRS